MTVGSTTTEFLFRVTLPYACFGIIVKDGTVFRAAPIAGWTVGRPFSDVLSYYRRKGASVDPL